MIKVYAVLVPGSLVGLYTAATDAVNVGKALHDSSVVSCLLNAETTTGSILLQNVCVGARKTCPRAVTRDAQDILGDLLHAAGALPPAEAPSR